MSVFSFFSLARPGCVIVPHVLHVLGPILAPAGKYKFEGILKELAVFGKQAEHLEENAMSCGTSWSNRSQA